MDEAAGLASRLPVLAILAASLLLAMAAPALRRALPDDLSALDPDAPLWRNLAIALLLGAAVWVTATAGQYGYNVDESFQIPHARALYEWYRALLVEGRFQEFRGPDPVMDHYGGFFELLAELAVRVLPGDALELRHRLTAWTGVAGIGATYLLGVTLHSRAAGFFAALALLLTPRFYGHFFNNPKDIPFAVAMTVALVAICRSLPFLPRLPLRRVLLVGGAVGIAAAIRVGGLIALLYFCAALLWSLIASVREAKDQRSLRADIAGVLTSGLGVLCVAWLVMLVFWPWALHAPVLRPLQAAGYFHDIVGQQQIDFRVLFDGRYWRLSEVPRYFTVKFLAISLPEFALLAPLLLLPLLPRLRHRSWHYPDARGMAWILNGLAIGLPLSLTVSHGLIQYDGVRHFLFVFPPLAACFAAGLVATLSGATATRLGAALAGASLLLAGLVAFDMGRLHPYEYTYYNRTIGGGVAAASTRHDTEYLGLAYREAVRWVVDHYQPAHDGTVRISACPGYLPNLRDGLAHAGPGAERYQPVRPQARAEVAVAATLVGCAQRYQGERLAVVGRAGAPFVHILRLR